VQSIHRLPETHFSAHACYPPALGPSCGSAVKTAYLRVGPSFWNEARACYPSRPPCNPAGVHGIPSVRINLPFGRRDATFCRQRPPMCHSCGPGAPDSPGGSRSSKSDGHGTWTRRRRIDQAPSRGHARRPIRVLRASSRIHRVNNTSVPTSHARIPSPVRAPVGISQHEAGSAPRLTEPTTVRGAPGRSQYAPGTPTFPEICSSMPSCSALRGCLPGGIAGSRVHCSSASS
jgi:hypothetical protein